MSTAKAVTQIPQEDLAPVERGHGGAPAEPLEQETQFTPDSKSSRTGASNGQPGGQIAVLSRPGAGKSDRALRARDGRGPAEDGGSGMPAHERARVQRGAPTSPSTEIELKLLIEPDQVPGLIDAPIIAAHARSKGTVRLLKDTYFDTAAGALREAGVTLRVRQCGKSFVQTVKLAPTEADIALRRGEWEARVAGMAPDFQTLAPLISMGLRDVLEHNSLEPIFETEVRRRLRTLRLPSGVVEVAFDSGLLRSGQRTAPISEIEIELKSGGAAALYDVALPLAEQAALRPTMRTKAERGLELALDAPPAVHWSSQLLPAGDISLDDAFAQFLRSALQQLVLNQPAAEDGRDPEGIHQLRIALRRLRCALTLLRPLAPSAMLASLRADAKWLAGALGSARNWDVFLGQTLTEVAEACSTVAGFDAVRQIAEQSCRNGYAAARAALADRRVGRFELALGAWVEQRGWRCNVAGDRLPELAAPAVAFAARALAKQHDRVLKRGRHFKRLPLEGRHELRLAVKKLRYTADFFLPLLGADGAAKRYARRLSRLQERLGRYNDAGTTRHLLAELAPDAMPAAAREAFGAVLGWQAARLASSETEVRAAWRDFRDVARPWAGRRSVVDPRKMP
jgi:inorganic triphosphatase YgiF